MQLDGVTVLLVDDDEHWAWATGRLLERDDPFTVEFAHSLAAGRERFRNLDPDCVVCDYDLGDGHGLELLETVRGVDPDRPFVLVTGKGDEGVASEAIGRGVTDYIRKGQDDAGDVLASRVANGVYTYRTERALERQRRTKTGILDVLRGTTSEAALCRQFCRRLVEDDAYALAWIGTPGDGGAILPRTSAGRDGYLDAVVDRDGVAAGEPATRAHENDESVVVPEIDAGDASTSWPAAAAEHGIESAIAAPIRYEGVSRGVLAVYLSTSAAADPTEARVIAEYAESVGYALRSLDRRRSLLSDHAIRVEVAVEDASAPLVALIEQLPAGARIECPSVVDRNDDTTLYLADVTGASADAIRSAATDVSDLRVDDLTTTRSTARCALVARGTTPEGLLGSHGARFEETVVEAGVGTISIFVGEDELVSRLVSVVEQHYETATVTTVWTDQQPGRTTDHPFAELTDKQREILRHTFHEGYFERPREANATEIASRLDITRQTLAQHLRTAERKLIATVLEEYESG